MGEKRQFLDVWIVDSNTVYREVPFTVVADWVQQGRLLENDQVRNSKAKDWQRLGDVPAFAAYLPKPEPLRATDEAEALERIELDFHWKKPHREEDEEVDMIPLIDVSLVLLIFFMLSPAGGGIASFIAVPAAQRASIAEVSGIWIGVNLEGDGLDRTVVYSIGENGRPSPDDADRNIRDRSELLKRLDLLLEKKTAKVEVTINAHKDVEDGLIVDLTLELGKDGRRAKISQKFTGVTEKLQ
jgi:biopolymer transport protein ExbD